MAAYWLHVGWFLGSAPVAACLYATKRWFTEDQGVVEMWHSIQFMAAEEPRRLTMLSRWCTTEGDLIRAASQLSEDCKESRAFAGIMLCYGNECGYVREHAARLQPPVFFHQPGGSESWHSLMAPDNWSLCPGCGAVRRHESISVVNPQECFSDHYEAACGVCRAVEIRCLCGEGTLHSLTVGQSHTCACRKHFKNLGSHVEVGFGSDW